MSSPPTSDDASPSPPIEASEPETDGASASHEPVPEPALPPTLGERVLAIPSVRRRLLGIVGVVIGLLLLAIGLGSLDMGSAPVSVPGSVLRGTGTQTSR